jgi:hypothetical protein
MILTFSCGVSEVALYSDGHPYLAVGAPGSVPAPLTNNIVQIIYENANYHNFAIYRSHPAAGDDVNLRKRVKRLLVYGSGLLTAGSLWISADGRRTEGYIALGGDANLGILCQQETTLTGYYFDATLAFSGPGRVTRLEWDMTPIG